MEKLKITPVYLGTMFALSILCSAMFYAVSELLKNSPSMGECWFTVAVIAAVWVIALWLFTKGDKVLIWISTAATVGAVAAMLQFIWF